jgi:radical SAM protein with 4Fe4S-binding SPASM domain
VLYYYLGIAKRLTLRRLINLGALYIGYLASRITKNPVSNALPFSVSIEPTTSCNLRCPQCPSGLRSFTRPTGMLSEDAFGRMIGKLSDTVHAITFYFQGEPFLNPAFLSMVKKASAHNIYTSTSTNGHYLTPATARNVVESGLDKLIISIDGTTQEVYAAYREGGNLAKVIAGTEEVLKQKRALRSRTPHVIWQFIVFRENEHQVADIRRLGKKLGVDEVRIKTAQIYEYASASDMIPSNEAYSRYARNPDGTYAVKNRLLDKCWRMWQGCVITWDGKVVPCCFDKDASHVVGDLNNSSFEEIWRSEAYMNFRRQLLTGRSQIDICRNCSEGTRVWA